MDGVWPPTLAHIVNFVLYLASKQLSSNTVQSYLAGLSFFIKCSGNVDHTGAFIVKKLIEGMRRTGVHSMKRAPITLHNLIHIIRILPNICSSSSESELFAALFSFTFFGFFRVGELTVTDRLSSSKIVALQDIEINSSSIRVNLRFSKTDQYGVGCSIQIPNCQKNACICPVRLVQKYLLIRPHCPGPLFIHFNHSPVTRYQFAAVLRKALQFLNLDSTRIKTHSFRIGAATWAASEGCSNETIQSLGRWRSGVFQRYIRVPVSSML